MYYLHSQAATYIAMVRAAAGKERAAQLVLPMLKLMGMREGLQNLRTLKGQPALQLYVLRKRQLSKLCVLKTPGRVGYVLRGSTRWPAPPYTFKADGRSRGDTRHGRRPPGW